MGFFDFLKKKSLETVDVESNDTVKEEKEYKYREGYEVPFEGGTLDLSEYDSETENALAFEVEGKLLYVKSNLPLRHSEPVVHHNYLIDEDQSILETYVLYKEFKVTNLVKEANIKMTKDGVIKIKG